MQFQDEREILCQIEKKYFVKSFPTQRPKGAQTPSNCHISPKCWQNTSNTNIFILLTHVSQPSARRVQRHLPTVTYPPNVGRKYPIQIYLFNWCMFPNPTPTDTFPLSLNGSLFRDPGPYRDLFWHFGSLLGLYLFFRVPIFSVLASFMRRMSI